MVNRRVATVALLAAVAFVALSALAVLEARAAPIDPLAGFWNAEGGITVPGDAFTPELQRLLFPPPLPETYWTYAPEKSAYPTLNVEGTERDYPRYAKPPSLGPPGAPDLGPLAGWFRGLLSFDWLLGRAAAADRFAVFNDPQCTNTLIATDTDCWATVSGGGTAASVPGTADIAILDANSGTSGTQDAAMSVLRFSNTAGTTTWNTGNFAFTAGTSGFTLSSTTFNAGSSTITSSGTTNMTGGTFGEGTSTLSLSGTFTLTMDVVGTAAVNNVFNVTIASGNITLGNELGVAGNFTASASTIVNSNCSNGIFFNGTSTMTRGASVTWWAPVKINTSGAFSLAGGEYRGNAPTLEILSAVTVTPGADVTLSTACGGAGAGDFELETGTYAKGTTTLTVQGDLLMSGGDLTSTSGAASITLTVNISSALSAIDFGSETWTVSGLWTNASTDAAWDAGTGTMTFDAGASQTMTFAGANLAEDEFNAVTFNSTAAITYTMATRGLRLGGALTITDTVTTVALSTSASNLAITAGSVAVSTNGTLTANGSTITVNGNWNTGAGTFTQGTSTVVFAASGTLDSNGDQFNSITVNIGVTTTIVNSNVTTNGVATINGTLTSGAGFGIRLFGSNATPLVIGGSGSVSGAGSVTYRLSVDYNVTATTYSGLVIQGTGAAGRTGTAQGNITVTGAAGFSVGEDGNSLLDILAMGANNLTISNASAYSVVGAGTTTPGALTFASGVLSHSGASSTVDIGAGGGYVRWGSASHTITGAYLNASTSSSWDAGTGTVTFNATSAQSMTFGNTGLGEAEFNNASLTGATTFTVSGSLYVAATLTVGASATVAMGTNDLQFDRLDVNGTVTMDGQTIDNIDIDTDTGVITVTAWARYSVAGGLPDIQWTMDPTVVGASITISVEGLGALETFALYRDNAQVVEAASDVAGTVAFILAGGWSPHTMIINVPGLTFGGGGGGGGGAVEPVVRWTWRHLSEDLTVQLVVSSARANQKYEWLVGGQSIGFGAVLEYTFQLSGTYTVILRTTIAGTRIVESGQAVTAVSLSFIGRYLPILLLVVITVAFISFIIMEAYDTDVGRVYALLLAIGALAAGLLLVSSPFKTFPTNGETAIRAYLGVGLFCAHGMVKTRAIMLALAVLGLILLVPVYLLIMG